MDNMYLATCSSDKTCIVWQLCDVEPENQEEGQDPQTYEEYVELDTMSGHGGWVWDCDFTCDNNFLITVSTDCKARIWRMGRQEIRQQLIGHSKGITCLAFCDQQKDKQ